MLPSTLNPRHLATLSSVLCLILFLTKKHNQSFMIVLHAVRTYMNRQTSKMANKISNCLGKVKPEKLKNTTREVTPRSFLVLTNEFQVKLSTREPLGAHVRSFKHANPNRTVT